MQSDPPLSLYEMRVLEEQVRQQPADPNGAVPFLKSGMLAVIRTAIAAMEELERVKSIRAR